MTSRNVTVKIEEGGASRTLGSSDDLDPYTQITISPVDRSPKQQSETPAVAKFDNLNNYLVFVVFQVSDEKKIPALIDKNTPHVSLSFVDMMSVKIINILTEEELNRITENFGIEKAFEQRGLHRYMDGESLKDRL